jgi:hypothetical protein
MSKLKTMEKIVIQILEEKPQARKNDYLLWLFVCEVTCPHLMNFPFWVVIQNHSYELPNLKSVERARRKIQEKYPELKSFNTMINRKKEEELYKEYSRT